MNRSNSRSSSIPRRKGRSSYSKYDSPSPERIRVRRSRSPSNGRSRSRRYRDDSDRYSPSNESSKRNQSYKVLCVSALHSDASDDVIKEHIYTEYKRFGDFVVKMAHDSNERVAYICFRNTEDAKEAMHGKRRILIFDKVAIVEPVFEKPRRLDEHRHRGRSSSRSPPDYDRYYRSRLPLPTDPARYYDRIPYVPIPPVMPPDYRRDLMPLPPPGAEYLPLPHHPMMHPLPPPMYGPRPFLPYPGVPYHATPFSHEHKKFPNYLHHIPPEDDVLATRTLFAGNLDLGISKEELKRIFAPYGVIEDIDVKRPATGQGTAYAFVRFKNLDMAHKAKVELSGKFIGKFQLKIGYGKATPTTRIWVGGLGSWTSSAQLEREFDRFGAIKKIDYDKEDNCAYILYDSIDAATSAVKEMRGFPLGGSDHKLRVDFADVGGNSPVRRNRDDDSDDDNRRRRRRSSSRSRYNGGSDRERKSLTPYGGDDNWDDDVTVETARSLYELAAVCTKTWEGAFALKNSLFPVKFHLTDGNSEVIDSVLTRENGKPLKIAQRLHLNPTKLCEVNRSLNGDKLYGVFLALPEIEVSKNTSFDDASTAGLQTKSVQSLISYLKQKEAAGVPTLSSGAALYAFPPCSFSNDLLKKKARNLTDDALKKDHLIIVVVKA